MADLAGFIQTSYPPPLCDDPAQPSSTRPNPATDKSASEPDSLQQTDRHIYVSLAFFLPIPSSLLKSQRLKNNDTQELKEYLASI